MEWKQEAGIVQIDFSATFDRVNHNHQGILFKHCSVASVGVQASMLLVIIIIIIII